MRRLSFFLLVFLALPITCLPQTSFEEFAAAAAQAREANDVSRAIELYRSALALKPEWSEGLFYLGSLLYDSDQFATAEAALDRFVKATPNASPAFGLLGLCEFETGHYKEALTHIQTAPAQTGQMDAVLRFHEAQLLTKTAAYDDALKLFSAFLRNGKAPDSVAIPLGIAALRRPLMASEISDAQRELYIAAGQTAAAILSADDQLSRNLLSDLSARFPDAAGVHYLHGMYIIGQDPSEAMEEFKRELGVDQSNVSANAMLAWMLLNRREPTAALPYAKEAASATPDYPTADYAYGRSLSETGNVKTAILYLEKAVAADPANLEFHLALTSAYSKAGRTADARTERQRSMELAREVSPAYLH